MADFWVLLSSRVTSSVLLKLFTRFWDLRSNLFPKQSLARYRKDLEETLREMPFIYHGLAGEVMKEFVDVEVQSLDLANLQLKSLNRTIGFDYESRLQSTERVLFLGNAGVGKTTFQRYAILSLLLDPKRQRFVYAKERPIPIYVPLKAIDNSAPLPITRYILEEVAPFTGPAGSHRLESALAAKRIFLFLDGYDEIPFMGGSKNFVQEELGILFFGSSVQVTEEYSMVRRLANCRIWLSSRREFFEENKIAGLGSGRFPLTQGLAAMELCGVGNNRIRLAKIIFDKYRSRSRGYEKILSEEYFIYDVDSSRDKEIRRLSFNPLFLTIMCYIYAQMAIEAGTHEVKWSERFEDLIVTCIHLLLRDLDEYKARDLPPAHKAALLSRRNEFLEEKTRFLEFFAAGLFFQDKPLFSLDYIKERVVDFFLEYKSSSAELILEDMRESRSTHPSFALQLVFCGIFVIVGKSAGATLYDFPHRRFREVLAARYITALPDRYGRLLAEVDERQFSEFINVLVTSSGFKSADFQSRSLEIILGTVRRSPDQEDWLAITHRFFTYRPSPYNPGRELRRFILDAIAMSRPRFLVTKEMLEHVPVDAEFLEIIEQRFGDALTQGDSCLAFLCCRLLSHYNPHFLRERVARELQDWGRSSIYYILFYFACYLKPELLAPAIPSIAAERKASYYLFWALSCLWDSKDPAKVLLLERFVEAVDGDTLTGCFCVLAAAGSNRYEDIKRQARYSVDRGLFLFLLRLGESGLNQIEKSGDLCYIVTEEVHDSLVSFMDEIRWPTIVTSKGDRVEIGGYLKITLVSMLGSARTRIFKSIGQLEGMISSAFNKARSKAEEERRVSTATEKPASESDLEKLADRISEKLVTLAEQRKSTVYEVFRVIIDLTFEPPEVLEFFATPRRDSSMIRPTGKAARGAPPSKKGASRQAKRGKGKSK